MFGAQTWTLCTPGNNQHLGWENGCACPIRCIRERMQDLQAAHDSTVRNVLDKYAMLRQTVAEHNRALQQVFKTTSDRSISGNDFMQIV
eukprot:1161785-Pelagomonas_calceolata.AAC.9